MIFISTLFTLAYVARLIERFYFAGVGLSGGHGETGGDATGGSHGVAADGGHDAGDGSADGVNSAVPLDGAPTSPGVPDRVPPAALAVLLATTLAAVALGFAGFGFFEWFDPFLTEVFA